MKLTLKSQTSSKITLAYDKPSAATKGYLYFADGKQVARTMNPNDLEVTFGKVASGKYAVEAIDFTTVARAEYPEVAPPPPPPPPSGGPTKPGNLRVLSSLQTAIAIGWDASTDDVAVTNYRVYRDNALIGQGSGSAGGYADSWSDIGLLCGHSYAYAVEAFDADGNISPRATLTASTVACDPVPPPSGNVIKVSGTISGSTLLSQIAAAPAGALTVQPADGQSSFTVPDGIFQLNRDNVTFKSGKFQNIVAIDKGSGFVLDGCTAHGIGLLMVSNWTIKNCTVAINGQAWNSQWFGPIAGNWIEGCKNWQMLDSTFSGHYDAVDTSRHSEAWFICAGNDGGLIKGCTFDNGGTTGHLFWTYFEARNQNKPNPTNICVTACKFTRVHNPWFHTQVHGDIQSLPLNNRIDPTTCTFDSSATNICGNQGGIVSNYVKACSAP